MTRWRLKLRKLVPFVGGFKEIRRPTFPDTFVPLRKPVRMIEDQPDEFCVRRLPEGG